MMVSGLATKIRLAHEPKVCQNFFPNTQIVGNFDWLPVIVPLEGN
jgi:hypothetical protein